MGWPMAERAPAAGARTDESRAAEAVVVYTDGACAGNPGPGGWGALLLWRGEERELCGGTAHTTNNRMELEAAIRALRALKRATAVVLYTDSTYLRQGIAAWLPRWKANGWRSAARRPVRNADLWRRLDEAAAPHRIDWRWVKSHAGNPGNERADALARRGMAPFLGG